MAGEGPSAPDEPGARRYQDRDTEPIPRARPDANADDRPAEGRREDGDDLGGFAVGAPEPTTGPPHRADPYSGETYAGEPYGSEAAGGPYVGTASTGAYYPADDAPPRFTEEEFAGLQGDPGPGVYSTRRVLPLEDEPSSMVARYLFPTEKFRGEWKRHWIQLAREIVIAALATILMGYGAGLLGNSGHSDLMTVVILIWAIVMVYVIWRIADWYYDRFILTNKRVMVVNGLVTRNVGMMPLLRVTDMKYVQSPLGRLLNYGNFELESAGQDQALSKIRNLPNPNELYLRIVEEMYEPEAVEARLGRAAEGDSADGT